MKKFPLQYGKHNNICLALGFTTKTNTCMPCKLYCTVGREVRKGTHLLPSGPCRKGQPSHAVPSDDLSPEADNHLS